MLGHQLQTAFDLGTKRTTSTNVGAGLLNFTHIGPYVGHAPIHHCSSLRCPVVVIWTLSPNLATGRCELLPATRFHGVLPPTPTRHKLWMRAAPHQSQSVSGIMPQILCTNAAQAVVRSPCTACTHIWGSPVGSHLLDSSEKCPHRLFIAKVDHGIGVPHDACWRCLSPASSPTPACSLHCRIRPENASSTRLAPSMSL